MMLLVLLTPSSYMTDGYVQQLGRGATAATGTASEGESSILRSYKFFDVFPITVGEIALSYDTTDTLEEFDVTFRYQYFTIGNSAQSSGGSTGRGLDYLINSAIIV